MPAESFISDRKFPSLLPCQNSSWGCDALDGDGMREMKKLLTWKGGWIPRARWWGNHLGFVCWGQLCSRAGFAATLAMSPVKHLRLQTGFAPTYLKESSGVCHGTG